ncbi:MAG: hypothetical protein J7L56_03150 [Halomonas sp.]|nr:hypothetical protein [Halomonas sp.]MCD6437247.1 hypothetical protein [Halomonas sp.]
MNIVSLKIHSHVILGHNTWVQTIGPVLALALNGEFNKNNFKLVVGLTADPSEIISVTNQSWNLPPVDATHNYCEFPIFQSNITYTSNIQATLSLNYAVPFSEGQMQNGGVIFDPDNQPSLYVNDIGLVYYRESIPYYIARKSFNPTVEVQEQDNFLLSWDLTFDGSQLVS